MPLFLSVVIRSKDEADRLRLTLVSLVGQSGDYEVIVVNDGSSDHTPEVLSEAKDILPLKVVTHCEAQGRSAASNAGARVAKGEILLFLDGDTLAGPGLLQAHQNMHSRCESAVGRGELFHLRCTRLLRDPHAGIPWETEAKKMALRSVTELNKLQVTLQQVRDDFGQISQRAEPGIYPGLGPRKLNYLENDALANTPDCQSIWSTACGSNMSVRRDDFLASGGYNLKIDINEHRELALRLINRGAKMIRVLDAPTYHMTHRSGWRDPLKDLAWEHEFLKVHPIASVALLPVLWGSISTATVLPNEYRITSLLELDQAAGKKDLLDYDVARTALGLRPLGRAFWRNG